jgi:hypothetical protein
MKKIWIAAFLLVFASVYGKNDWELNQLKGNVQSIKTYYLAKKSDKIVKDIHKETLSFNEKGNLTQSQHYKTEDKSFINGEIMEISYFF